MNKSKQIKKFNSKICAKKNMIQQNNRKEKQTKLSLAYHTIKHRAMYVNALL